MYAPAAIIASDKTSATKFNATDNYTIPLIYSSTREHNVSNSDTLNSFP